MAESYRGLTIRIGADVTKLGTQLRAANSAISTTMGQATRLKRALVMDPGNTGMISKYVESVGRAAEESAYKLAALKDGYERALNAKSKVDPSKTISELAAETDDAVLAAERLKDRYTRVGTELATIYTDLTNKMHALGHEDVKFDHQHHEIEEIKAAYRELFESEGYRGSGLEAAVNRAVARVKELQERFGQVSDAYDDARAVAALRDTEIEIDVTAAKAKNLGQQFSSMFRSDIGQDLDVVLHKFGELGSSARDAASRYQLLNNSLKLNPLQLGVVIERTKALASEMRATRDQANLLKRKIDEYKAAGIDRLAAQTRDAAAAAKKAKDDYDAAAQRVRNLEGALEVAKNHSQDMVDVSKRYGNEWVTVHQTIRQTEQELAEARQEAAGLEEELKTANAVAEFQKLNDKLVETHDHLREIGTLSALGGVGTATVMLAEQIGQYTKQGLDQIVTATMELDDAFTSMKKTTDTTAEGYQYLYDMAVEASTVQPITAAQILNAEALGGQLGFAADELEQFASVANGLDISTNMSWEQAATNLAQYFNIFDTGHGEVERYGSTIVELGNNMATTESAISDMAMRIAGAGATIGLSEADVLGLSAALTSMGLTAEAGGASISTIMSNIDKSVAHGTDGIENMAQQWGEMSGEGVKTSAEFLAHIRSLDEDGVKELAKSFGLTSKQFLSETTGSFEALQAWSDAAGMTADEFAQKWSEDPVEALSAVFTGLDEATDANENLNLLLEELGIKSLRQLDVSKRWANNSELAAEAIEMANNAWEENSALTEEVNRRNESLSGQYETMKNSISAVKSELGEGLLPYVQLGADLMKKLADAMNEMPTETKTGIVGAMGALAAVATIGPAVTAIAGQVGVLMDSVSLLGTTIAAAASSSTVLTGGLAAVATGIGGVLSVAPALGVVLGGLAIGAVAKFAYNAFDAKKKQDAFNEALSGMSGYADVASDDIKRTADAFRPMLDNVSRTTSSVEELTEAITAHNDAMREIQTDYEIEAYRLSDYKSIFDDFKASWNDQSEQYELTSQKMALVEYALDGINQQYGTNITMEELLAGAFEDENGEMQNTIAYIEDLIEKRQELAKIEADQELLAEARENKYRADRNQSRAEQDLADAMDMQKAKAEELIDQGKSYGEAWAEAAEYVEDKVGMSFDELRERVELAGRDAEAAAKEVQAVTNMKVNDQALQDAKIDVEEFYAALEEAGVRSDALANISTDAFGRILSRCGDDINAIITEIDDYNSAAYNNAAAIRVLTRDTPEFGKALGDIDLNEFSAKLNEAGVQASDLEAIGTEKFAQLAEECGGDIDSLVSMLQIAKTGMGDAGEAIQLFAEEFPAYGDALVNSGVSVGYFAQKCAEAGISVDDLSTLGEQNLRRLAIACDGDVELMVQRIGDFNKAKLENKDVAIDSHGNVVTGEAARQVSAYNDAAQRVPSQVESHVRAIGADSAADSVWNLYSAITSLPWEKTVNVRTNNIVTYQEQAAGGIRFHAGGGIVDRPSWLGTRDIVGEAGAEAIIPLTNRKYVSPFADTVAEELMQKLGSGGGDNITIQLNYEAGTDATTMVRDLARQITMHKATRGRW